MFSTQNRKWSIVLGCAAACSMIIASGAYALPMTTFDSGLEGWQSAPSPFAGEPFAGVLHWEPTGGNPDGFIWVEDIEAGSGGLFVKAPVEFNGDLSVYTELRWDEYNFTLSEIGVGTRAFLKGADGTLYRSDDPMGPLTTWINRSVPLTADQWELRVGSGTASFEDVLADAELYINLEISQGPIPTLEAGIDNVTLVPEPTSGLLIAAAALVLMRRRRGC